MSHRNYPFRKWTSTQNHMGNPSYTTEMKGYLRHRIGDTSKKPTSVVVTTDTYRVGFIVKEFSVI